MRKEDIHLWDIRRILLGQAPPSFLLETFIRTVFMYLLLLVMVRVLGKRMKGQLTIVEMAVLVMLGAIISVPMQVPDRGLLQGVIILLATVSLQRGLTWLEVKRKRVEIIMVGKPELLVRDGVIQLDALKKVAVSREELFAVIRAQKVLHLGKIDRLYLEACGLFSILHAREERPGLPVLPGKDPRILEAQRPARSGICACNNCGTLQPPEEAAQCPSCGSDQWKKAIV